ncbi:hypothetical protein CSB09_02185 [Candidatus Gracilibacteria bacterium]|nr:MAG: hypothetical protein CSB09_02185 [Candidatus Gracilibacteria bacterium]
MRIIPFETTYTKELQTMMQLLRDYIVSLDFWEDDMITIDVSKNIKSIIQSFENKKLLIYLALENQKVIGFVLGKVKNESDEGSKIKKIGSIGQLYVFPEYQKMGVGRHLIKSIEQECKKQGATHMVVGVFAGNPQALGFYEKYGFEKRLITLGKKI